MIDTIIMFNCIIVSVIEGKFNIFFFYSGEILILGRKLEVTRRWKNKTINNKLTKMLRLSSSTTSKFLFHSSTQSSYSPLFKWPTTTTNPISPWLNSRYYNNNQLMLVRHTTILCLRSPTQVVLTGDGQMTEGRSIKSKSNVIKVRRIKVGEDGEWDVLVGFAGSTADCIALVDLLEQKIKAHPQQLARACVEVAKGWRTNKIFRNLEAILLVADRSRTFKLSGDGNVIEPQDGLAGIGSGGNFAVAAARGILQYTSQQNSSNINLEQVAKIAMNIATDMDTFSNSTLTLEKLDFSTSTTGENKQQ
jgi:ATP-dependent HslUV protease subunit HslV